MKIGFIGLGNMGKPMALNLIKSGYELTGFDIQRSSTDVIVEAGGKRADTIDEVILAAELILTSLPSSEACEQVYLGENGLLAKVPQDVILVDTSTVAPDLENRIGAEADKRHFFSCCSGKWRCCWSRESNINLHGWRT